MAKVVERAMDSFLRNEEGFYSGNMRVVVDSECEKTLFYYNTPIIKQIGYGEWLLDISYTTVSTVARILSFLRRVGINARFRNGKLYFKQNEVWVEQCSNNSIVNINFNKEWE